MALRGGQGRGEAIESGYCCRRGHAQRFVPENRPTSALVADIDPWGLSPWEDSANTPSRAPDA